MSRFAGERAGRLSGVEGPVSVWLVCRARTRLCAVPIESLVETMRPLPITPFPGTPSFVRGVARIRGVAVPVIDLGVLLGSPEPARPTRFITLRLADHRVALAVEEVLGLRQLLAEIHPELPPLLAHADQEAVAAIGMLDAELLLSLEASRIVPESLWSLLDAGRPA
jgi:purine-binding chemotaxis protein CheW